jgi:hypothetical protein
MPQNTSIAVNSSAWSQLTDANVTEITFQLIRGGAIYVQGTNGAAAPNASSVTVGLRYEPGQGESRTALADLFPGVTGVNRVWARSAEADKAAEVFVSHA